MRGTDPPRFLRRLRSNQTTRSQSSARVPASPSVPQAIDALTGSDPAARAAALEFAFRDGDHPEARLTSEDDERVAKVILRATERGPLEASELIGLVGRCRGSLRHQAVLFTLAESIDERGIGDANLGFLLSTVGSMESAPSGEESAAFVRLAGAIGRARLIQELDEPGPRRLGAIRLLVAERSTGFVAGGS
jgi:hypothetical protein